jgi:hypothetical protein
MGANQTTVSDFETRKSKFIEYVFDVHLKKVDIAKNATIEARKNYADKLDGLNNLEPETLSELAVLREKYIETSKSQNKVMKDSDGLKEDLTMFLDKMDQRFETQKVIIRTRAEEIEAARLEAETARELAAIREAEIARLEAEQKEAARLEDERRLAEQREAARLEEERQLAEQQIRLEEERQEAARLEAARLEAERLEAARIEAARIEAARLEVERLEAERLEAERIEAERIEAKRLEAERIEAERLEAERIEAARVEVARLETERQEVVETWFERLEEAITNITSNISGKSPEELDLLIQDITDTVGHIEGIPLNEEDLERINTGKNATIASILTEKERVIAVNDWFTGVQNEITNKTSDINSKNPNQLESLINEIEALYSAVGNIQLNEQEKEHISEEKDTTLAPIKQQKAILIAQEEERQRVLAEENRQTAVNDWFVGVQNRVADAIRDSPQTNLRELESLIDNINGIFENVGAVPFNESDKTRIEEEKKLILAPILAEQDRLTSEKNNLQNTDAPKLEKELMTLVYEPITDESLRRIQEKITEFTEINKAINRLNGTLIVESTPHKIGSSAEKEFKRVLIGVKKEQFGNAVKHASEELASLKTIEEVETLEELKSFKTRVLVVKKSLEDETAALKSYCDSSQRLFPETVAEIENIKTQNKALIANQYEELAKYEASIIEIKDILTSEKEALDAASSKTESAIVNFNTAFDNVSAALGNNNLGELQGLAITSQKEYESLTSAFEFERQSIITNTQNTQQQKASLQALQEKEMALSKSHEAQMRDCALIITQNNREAATKDFTLIANAIMTELKEPNIDFNNIDELKVQLTAQYKTAQLSIESEKSTVWLIPPTHAVLRDTLLNELSQNATQLKTSYQKQMRDCILTQVNSETNAVTLKYNATSQEITNELKNKIIDYAKLDTLKKTLQEEYEEVLIAITTEKQTIKDNTPDITQLGEINKKEDALKQSYSKQLRDCVLSEAKSKTYEEISKYNASYNALNEALAQEKLDLSALDGLKEVSQDAFNLTMSAMETEMEIITTNIQDEREKLKTKVQLDTNMNTIKSSHEKQLINFNLRISSFNTQSFVSEYDDTLQKVRSELAKDVIDPTKLDPLKEELQQKYNAILIAITTEKQTITDNTFGEKRTKLLEEVDAKQKTIMGTHVQQMSDCVISEASSKSKTAILVFQDIVNKTNNYLMTDHIVLTELDRLSQLLQEPFNEAFAALESEKNTIISNVHTPEQLSAVNEKIQSLIKTNTDITTNVSKSPKVLAAKADIIFQSYNNFFETNMVSINEDSLNVVQDTATLETIVDELVKFANEIKTLYGEPKSGTPYDQYIAEQNIRLETLKNLIGAREDVLGEVIHKVNTAKANAEEVVASSRNNKIIQVPIENIRKIRVALLQLSEVLSSQEKILNPSDEIQQLHINEIKGWLNEKKSENDKYENALNESIRQGHILAVHSEIRQEVSKVESNLKDLVRVKQSVTEKYNSLKDFIKEEEKESELIRQKADEDLLTGYITIIEAQIEILVNESKELNYNVKYEDFENTFKDYKDVTQVLETAKKLVPEAKKHVDLLNKINQKRGETGNVDYLLTDLEDLIYDLEPLAEEQQYELSILRFQSNNKIKEATGNTQKAREKASAFITSLNNLLPKETITTSISDASFDEANRFINLAEETAQAEIRVMDEYGKNIEGFDGTAQVQKVSTDSAMFKQKQESMLESIKSTYENRKNFEEMKQQALYETAKRLTDSASHEVSYDIDDFKADIDKLTFETVGAAFITWNRLVTEKIVESVGRLKNVNTKFDDELKILEKLEIKRKKEISTERTKEMQKYQSDNLEKIEQISRKMKSLESAFKRYIQGKSETQLLDFYISSLSTSQTFLTNLLTEMELEIKSDKFVVTNKIVDDIRKANHYVSFIWTLCNTKGVLTEKNNLKEIQRTVLGYQERLDKIIVYVNEISAKEKETISEKTLQNNKRIAELEELTRLEKIFKNYEQASKYQNEVDSIVFENTLAADLKDALEENIVKINQEAANFKEDANRKLLGDDSWVERTLVSWALWLFEFLKNRMRYGLNFPEVLKCFSDFQGRLHRMTMAESLRYLGSELERIGGGYRKYGYGFYSTLFMSAFDGIGVPLILLYSLMTAIKKLWPFGTKTLPKSFIEPIPSEETTMSREPSGDETRKPSGDETRKPSGDETRKPSVAETTRPSDAETTRPSVAETTRPSEAETTTDDTESPTLEISQDTESSELGSESVSDASAITQNTVNDVCLKYDKMFLEDNFMRGGSLPDDNYEALFLEDDRNVMKHNYDELFEEDIQIGGVNPLGQSELSMGINASERMEFSQPNTSGYVKSLDSQKDDLKDILGLDPLKDLRLTSADGTEIGFNPLKWKTQSGYYETTNEDGEIVIWLDGPPVPVKWGEYGSDPRLVKDYSSISDPFSLLNSYYGIIPEEIKSPTYTPINQPPIFEESVLGEMVDSTGRVVKKIFGNFVDYVSSLYPESEQDKEDRLLKEAEIVKEREQKKRKYENLYNKVSSYRAKSLEEKLADLAKRRAENSRQAYDVATNKINEDKQVISEFQAKNERLEREQERVQEESREGNESQLRQIADEISEGDFQIQQAAQRIKDNSKIISDYEALLQETPEQKARREANEAKDDLKTVETNDQYINHDETELNRQYWNDWRETLYSGYRFFPSNYLNPQNKIGQAEFGPHVNEKDYWIRVEKQKYYEEVTSKFLPRLTTIKMDNNLSGIDGFNLRVKEVISDGRCFSGSALYLFKLNEKKSEEARRREAKDNLIFSPNYNVNFDPTEEGNGDSEELDNWIGDNIIGPIESKRGNNSDTDLVNFVYAYNFINGKKKKDSWNDEVDEVFRSADRNLIMAALDQLFLNEKIRYLLYKLEHFFEYEKEEDMPSHKVFSLSNLFTNKTREKRPEFIDYLALRGPGENLPEEKKFDVETNKELLALLKIEDKDVSKINFEILNTALVEISMKIKSDPRFEKYYDEYINYIKSLNKVLKKGDPYIPTTASSRAIDTLGKALGNWRNFFKVPSDGKKRVFDSYPWTEPDVGPAQVLADIYKTNIIIRSESNYNKLNIVYNPRDENNKFFEASTTINLLFMNMNGASHYIALIDPEFHQELKGLPSEIAQTVEEVSTTLPSSEYTIMEINVGGNVVENGYKGTIDETNGKFVETDQWGEFPFVFEPGELITRDFVEVNPDGTIMKEDGIVIKHGKMGKMDGNGIFEEIPPPISTASRWMSYLFTPKVHHFVEVYPENTFQTKDMIVRDGMLQQNTYDLVPDGPDKYKKVLKGVNLVSPLVDDALYLKLSNITDNDLEESKRNEQMAPGFKTIEGPRKAIINGKDAIYDYDKSRYITTSSKPMAGGSSGKSNHDYEALFEMEPEPVVIVLAKDYTELFEMEPEPIKKDYTELFEMEPEPIKKDYTDLFEMDSEPEPEPVVIVLAKDYTDLFETDFQ